jgi:hypothetical protein
MFVQFRLNCWQMIGLLEHIPRISLAVGVRAYYWSLHEKYNVDGCIGRTAGRFKMLHSLSKSYLEHLRSFDLTKGRRKSSFSYL